MTTIAWDGQLLAADSQLSIGDTPVHGHAKLFALRRMSSMHMLVGISGCQPRGWDLVREFCAHWKTIQIDPNLAALQPLTGEHQATVMVAVLKPADRVTHRMFLVTRDGGVTDMTARKWAIGSGADYALGAMGAGANALQAVRVAAELDVYTNSQPISWRVTDWINAGPDQFKDMPL